MKALETLATAELDHAVGGNGGNQTNGAINSLRLPGGGVSIDWNERNKHLRGVQRPDRVVPSTRDANGVYQGGWGIG